MGLYENIKKIREEKCSGSAKITATTADVTKITSQKHETRQTPVKSTQDLLFQGPEICNTSVIFVTSDNQEIPISGVKPVNSFRIQSNQSNVTNSCDGNEDRLRNLLMKKAYRIIRIIIENARRIDVHPDVINEILDKADATFYNLKTAKTIPPNTIKELESLAKQAERGTSS